MRISSSVITFVLASVAAASPLTIRGGGYDNGGDVGYPGHGGPDVGYPGHGGPGNGGPGGPGNGGPGNGGPGGPGNGGPGNGGPGNGGPGSGGPGNGGNGDNNGGNGGNNGGDGNGGNNGGDGDGNGGDGNGGDGNGGNSGNGGNGNVNSCGVTPGQISALTPLLNKLGLSTTIDGVKQLVDKLLFSVGGLLESPGINGNGGLIDLVNNLVKGLLGSSLDLHNTIDAVTSILENQVPCLLDTLLPKP
ncbi:hypothetical protein IW148_005303 [Coemansia sp. RSA 1199]|nr:hypothetical protein IW148_005303 [Coemansia sp. RSA 1199]